MNNTDLFWTVLAWFGLVIGIIRLIANLYYRHYLTTKLGKLDNLILQVTENKRYVAKPLTVPAVMTVDSAAWLVAYYLG